MRYRKRKVWKVLLLFLIVVSFTAAAVSAYFWFRSENEGVLAVEIHGQTELTVEYGVGYEEQGAEAWFVYSKEGKEPVPVQVVLEGQVDDQKIGDYEITYTAFFQEQTCTEKRTVHVVDTQAPVITLTGETAVTILPTENYQEAGFIATDNYDGDLTSQVKREEAEGKIVYTVTDSSGNTVSVERTITVNDPIAPALELKGSNYITLGIGAGFEEPGFTALDNCDGDLTAAVQVTGSVDIYKAGVYTLTYTVTDSYQNMTTAKREVCVLPLSQSDIGTPNGKVIYLTFDDGPGAYTEELLDILAKYNVKVTFFVVNTNLISKIERAAREGHTIAIHTATHRFDQVYASEEAYFADLYKMQEIIERYTGIKSTLVRFPGGSSNTISKDYCKGIMTRLAAALQEKGFTYFDWNVDSNDAGGAKTADEVYNNVVKGIGNKQYSVVLQHDMKRYSVDAVEKIIVWGLKNGYTFLPLDANSPTCHHGINN